MSYLPCKEPCFVGKLGNWIQVWLPQITQQCAHVLESRKIRKYRETWTLYVLSVPQTKPAGSFVLHGNVVDFYVSYVIHRLCLCIYIYIWYDILISWSWCLYILSYVNIMDKGASHSQMQYPATSRSCLLFSPSKKTWMVKRLLDHKQKPPSLPPTSRHRHKSTKWPNLVPQWSVTNTAFQVCHLEDVTRKMYFNNASIKKANKCVMDSKDSFLGKIIYGLGSNIAPKNDQQLAESPKQMRCVDTSRKSCPLDLFPINHQSL